MTYSRVLGHNIESKINSTCGSINDFASKVNFSVRDLHKICEGRLSLAPRDLYAISNALNIDVSDIIEQDKFQDKYVDCMGKFKNSDNQDKILDLIDMYIDLKESVNE